MRSRKTYMFMKCYRKCNESIKSVINYMKNEYNPNRDCIEFLKNNGKEYKDNYRSFNDFYEDEVKPELDDIARCD